MSTLAGVSPGIAPSPLFDATGAVFYWRSRMRRELDFAFSIGGKYVPVEVKYSSRIRKGDCYSIYDFLKTGKAAKGGIVVTKDVLEVGGESALRRPATSSCSLSEDERQASPIRRRGCPCQPVVGWDGPEGCSRGTSTMNVVP